MVATVQEPQKSRKPRAKQGGATQLVAVSETVDRAVLESALKKMAALFEQADELSAKYEAEMAVLDAKAAEIDKRIVARQREIAEGELEIAKGEREIAVAEKEYQVAFKEYQAAFQQLYNSLKAQGIVD